MKLLWNTVLFTGLAMAVAAPLAAMEKTLSGVEVKADLSAYEDSNVLKYWATMEEDLATAISSKLTIDDAADAPRITVEINKVAIDGDTVLPDTGEFNQLEGTVTTHEGVNNVNAVSKGQTRDALIGSYPLRISAVSGEREMPRGWVTVNPSQEDFYNAMINAYATIVVERIEE